MKILSTIMVAALAVTSLHAEPKKLLVVTTTMGFRHSSIPTAEKILAQLAKDSGEFTVKFVQQPPGKPEDLKPDATEEQKAAFKTAEDQWEMKLKAALEKLSPESLKNYDGVIFASTTGDLPIPDKQGLLDWIKAGHAFRRKFTNSKTTTRRRSTTCSSSTSIPRIIYRDIFLFRGARITARAEFSTPRSAIVKTSGMLTPTFPTGKIPLRSARRMKRTFWAESNGRWVLNLMQVPRRPLRKTQCRSWVAKRCLNQGVRPLPANRGRYAE